MSFVEFGLVAPKEFGLVAPKEFGLVAPKEFGLVAPKEFGLVAPKEFGLVAPKEFGLVAPKAWPEGSQGQGRAQQVRSPWMAKNKICRPGGPTEKQRPACLSPLRGWRAFLNDPGAACFALAPGYLLATPSALQASGDAFGATGFWPRLRRYRLLATPSALQAELKTVSRLGHPLLSTRRQIINSTRDPSPATRLLTLRRHSRRGFAPRPCRRVVRSNAARLRGPIRVHHVSSYSIHLPD